MPASSFLVDRNGFVWENVIESTSDRPGNVIDKVQCVSLPLLKPMWICVPILVFRTIFDTCEDPDQ